MTEYELIQKRNAEVVEHCLKADVVTLFAEEMANEIERISKETYGVVLVEHKEAADWLRLKSKSRSQESKKIDALK